MQLGLPAGPLTIEAGLSLTLLPTTGPLTLPTAWLEHAYLILLGSDVPGWIGTGVGGWRVWDSPSLRKEGGVVVMIGMGGETGRKVGRELRLGCNVNKR